MIIQVTLKKGGEWWHIDVPNLDSMKALLNTGRYGGIKIYSVLLILFEQPMIYDFVLKSWLFKSN